MYPFRATKSNSQESFFVLLVDGTTSMNAHYPIFLKCYHNVCSSIKHKLAFQFGNQKEGSDVVLYDINKFQDHHQSNFNKVFKQLFDILLTQHKDKKYLTICFISDGVEHFVYEEFLPLVDQITSTFKIQFASIAVGKNFPTSISNKFRERLHNNGNLDFPSIYEVMDQSDLTIYLDDNDNIAIQPEQQQKLTQQFTDALEGLKRQLIVFTEQIELNEIVYTSFLDIQDQKTKIVRCNQLFLSPNPNVQTTKNEIIQSSSNVEDLIQIQQGSVQQLLIHLQANDKIQEGKAEFQKLLDISKQSQKLFIKTNQQMNPQADLQEIADNPKLDLINKIIDQCAYTDYLASIKDNENRYAQLQANLEKNPQLCIDKNFQTQYREIKIEQILNSVQPMQQVEIEQEVQIKQQNKINTYEINFNSKLIILVDSFTLQKSLQEEILKAKQTVYNQQVQDNTQTFWWADTIQENPELSVRSQQLPLNQAILQILRIIEEDQSGVKNFTICLIISGEHQIDFKFLSQKQQQIQQQNKLIAFTTMIIENEQLSIDKKIEQQRLSLELRRQLHTNNLTHSLQVSARVKIQEFPQYLNLYFTMINGYQSKFYGIRRKGCFVRCMIKQKNAMFLLNQFISDIEESRQQIIEDSDFILNLQKIKQLYYKRMNNYKEQEFPDEKYCLAKLNSIFQCIDKINLQNCCDFLDQIFHIKLGFHDKNQKDFDLNQLNQARKIMQYKKKSNLLQVTITILVFGAIYLIFKGYKISLQNVL
ncbi:unnamed protein product (macronuclear) [Paramecium tetraurelia]|uniref:Chromosome undetermined scaffold_226, whole genome shotgun sequence n=1 Tax=Paramecium tetraurelia TaxID=5888 RepID=A0CNZ5_PARTE|nr:uncharacterized protein GSPATT00038781001 [Paramecium tetraurelia]XP_001458511.1 uncharacterized protein GSPATT00023842001 [Paramecium tetraurelia]CAK72512.1 unnamed protein product [Paramecium tetraurelia]CAK91114.1 unnamed protein product [Paramecium tetraurelia]|eukprot:XP_001439909.1 hypothetical protein (macronuclear) [Paramecium tetraurelia strain d4-2]